jgi:hypothetical protein
VDAARAAQALAARVAPSILKLKEFLNSSIRFVGFRSWKSYRAKILIFVGWVEVRNPTF